jgi:hypothetical protein
MTGPEKIERAYMIRVRRDGEADGVYHVRYVPRGLQGVRTPGKQTKQVPEHTATANVLTDARVTWDNPPVDPEATLGEFDRDARRRAKLVHDWLALLQRLIASVEAWALEFGWSSKRVEKPMEDSEVGQYKAPALLLQDEAARFLLEPVARAAPGAEGLVDLYLMPAYDDIASLYYYNNRWNLHYMTRLNEPIPNVRQPAVKPLTKVVFRKVIDELKEHAE